MISCNWLVGVAIRKRATLIEALKPSCDGPESRILMIYRVRSMSLAEVESELAALGVAA